MGAPEEKVVKSKQNDLPFSLQGMSPADVYREIQPLFQKDKTANFLAEVCVSYFNATHSPLDVIKFLQIVYSKEPPLDVTLDMIRTILEKLPPPPRHRSTEMASKTRHQRHYTKSLYHKGLPQTFRG